MVDLHTEETCFFVKVQACAEGKTEERMMLLSQLSDVLAISLYTQTQKIVDMCVATSATIEGTSRLVLGRIKEVWVCVDTPSAELYVMENGAQLICGSLEGTVSIERFNRVLNLDVGDEQQDCCAHTIQQAT